MKKTKLVILGVSLAWLVLSCTEGHVYKQVLDRAQQQNLNRDTITGIDSIQMAADYYDQHGTNKEAVRAYYLLGCAYRDAGEAPNALEAFHEAADRADTTQADCDYGLLMRVHSQSSELFKSQLLPYEMLDELGKQRHYAQLAGDDKSAIIAIERSADAYRMLDMKDSAVNIQLRASELYEQYGFHEEAAIAAGPIIGDLVERGDTARARRCIHRYEGSQSIFRDGEILPHKADHYYSKGKYCLAVGKMDSAEVYFRKLIEPGRNASQLEAGYRGLFLLYKERRATHRGQAPLCPASGAQDGASPRVSQVADSMEKYADLQYEQVIPTLADNNKDNIQQMQSLYNYSRIQSEAKKTAERDEQQKSMIIVLLVAVIALALVAVVVAKLLGIVLKRPTTHYINPQIDARRIMMTGSDAIYNENLLDYQYGQKDHHDGQ